MKIDKHALKVLSSYVSDAFPTTVGDIVITSLEHLIQFANPQFRNARLVKRKTAKSNGVQDTIPLGKIYCVGPSAFYIPLREDCYFTEEGWFPCELLELVP